MATKAEFAAVLAYLQAGCRAKEPPGEATADVYFDLLGDLPGEVLMAAAKRALIESAYPVFPPVGRLRQLAAELMAPPVPGPEAWRQALAAVRRFGAGKEREGLATLPPAVARAARAFGWRVLCDTTDADLGIAQTQFQKAYQALAQHEQQQALMPAALRRVAAGLAETFALEPPPRPALPAKE